MYAYVCAVVVSGDSTDEDTQQMKTENLTVHINNTHTRTRTHTKPTESICWISSCEVDDSTLFQLHSLGVYVCMYIYVCMPLLDKYAYICVCLCCDISLCIHSYIHAYR